MKMTRTQGHAVLRIFLAPLAGFALLTLTGCAALELVADGFDIAADVKENRPVIHKGKVAQKTYRSGSYLIAFKDGTSYEVDQSGQYLSPGDIVRIYKKDNGGFEAINRSFEQGTKVIEGQVKRVEFRSSTTVIHLVDNASYEVDGYLDLTPGARVSIYKDDFGFSAKSL